MRAARFLGIFLFAWAFLAMAARFLIPEVDDVPGAPLWLVTLGPWQVRGDWLLFVGIVSISLMIAWASTRPALRIKE